MFYQPDIGCSELVAKIVISSIRRRLRIYCSSLTSFTLLIHYLRLCGHSVMSGKIG